MNKIEFYSTLDLPMIRYLHLFALKVILFGSANLLAMSNILFNTLLEGANRMMSSAYPRAPVKVHPM